MLPLYEGRVPLLLGINFLRALGFGVLTVRTRKKKKKKAPFEFNNL